MSRLLLLAGAAGGLLTVLLGAFGAHGLEGSLPEIHLEWWRKAVDYQALHSLALLACGLLALLHPSRQLLLAGGSFVIGILLFSGSLYLLALTGSRSLGMVTPFGGVAFILGWFFLGLAAWRLPR
jgi:uncharacterized membrane protein YgdD (TMEM256/DUF423 family)